MLRAVVAILLLLSIVLLPWWVTVTLGVVSIVFFNLWYFAIMGGLVMDLAFGTPIALLGGFAYVYTCLFVGLSLLAMVLRGRMLE